MRGHVVGRHGLILGPLYRLWPSLLWPSWFVAVMDLVVIVLRVAVMDMGGASIGAGGSYPPHFFTPWGSRGYINSLQLFNNTTCLQYCNVNIYLFFQPYVTAQLLLGYTRSRIRLHRNSTDLRRLRLH